MIQNTRQKTMEVIESLRSDDREYLALIMIYTGRVLVKDLITLRYRYIFKANRKWRNVFYHQEADKLIKISKKQKHLVKMYCDYYEMEGNDYLFFNKRHTKKHITIEKLKRLIFYKLGDMPEKEAFWSTVRKGVRR